MSYFFTNFAADMKKSILLLCMLAAGVVGMSAETSSEPSKESSFHWSASATMTSNYIWRGLYCGGPSLQLDATVDYAGFYANMWWNAGSTDWTFSAFNPEVDLCVGFSRWGLNINYLHCFYFDQYPDGTPSKFFDFHNHPRGGGGTTGEWRISYRVSDKLPLSCLVAFRTFGRDGYYEQLTVDSLQLKRAYSTYIELGYDFAMGNNWQLDARVGVTPAKSLYTRFQGDFAVTLVGLKLHKTWEVRGERLKVKAFAHVMLQPWQVTKDNLIRPIAEAGDQKLNMAVGCSIAFGN
jgi:hypothetical protein